LEDFGKRAENRLPMPEDCAWNENLRCLCQGIQRPRMIQERPMGMDGSPGAGRAPAAGRSIRSVFTLTVTVPAVCLVLVWGLALVAVFGGAFSGRGLSWPGHQDLARLIARAA
jgi:hypothetical protein